MMISTDRFIVFTILLSCLSNQCSRVCAGSGDNVSVTYRVNQKRTECIYKNFEKSDFVTYSVFVVEALNNGPPKATISFEGPIAGNPDIPKKVIEITGGDYDLKYDGESNTPSLGRTLKKGMQTHWPIIKDSDKKVRYDKRMGLINRSLKVDWTHAGESEDAMKARAQIEQEKREAYRNRGRGAPREEGNEQNERFKAKVMAAIEPFEETNAIKAQGWYQLCVSSEYHALVVEMDMRSGRELGGVDRTTGHVYTHEAREMLDAEKLIDEVPEDEQEDFNTYETLSEEEQKAIENQVKEQDLHATKAQIKHLNSLVAEIKRKHHDFQQRIKSHKASSERNHENLLWSSKLETVLYIMITGVQVYTVRKWLMSNQLLGR